MFLEYNGLLLVTILRPLITFNSYNSVYINYMYEVPTPRNPMPNQRQPTSLKQKWCGPSDNSKAIHKCFWKTKQSNIRTMCCLQSLAQRAVFSWRRFLDCLKVGSREKRSSCCPKFIWGASMSVSLGDHHDGKHCIETFGKPSDVSLESKLEFKRFKMFASKQPWPPSRLFTNPAVKQWS